MSTSELRVDALPALYTDATTVAPGNMVQVMASGDGDARLSLVRLRGLVGSTMPTAYVEESVVPATTVRLEVREVPMGSYAFTEAGPHVEHGTSWSWTLRILPTLVDRGELLHWGDDGPRLAVRDGRLEARWGDVPISVPLAKGYWHEVTLGWEPGDGLGLAVRPVGDGAWHRTASARHGPAPSRSISGALHIGRGFNGKIEAPTLRVDGAVVAAWDFASEMTRQHAHGTGPAASRLSLVNAPRRAVTSSEWDGTAHDWTQRPAHYAAIHFHDDDLADCAWPVSAEIAIPAHLPSGIYAVRIDTALGTAHAPLFVRSVRPAKVVFVASTFSYLAYTNSVWASPTGDAQALAYPRDAGLARRYGLSMYCRHRDGGGIGLVSMRRPMLHATPGFLGESHGGQVALNDDLRIIAWLDRVGLAHDVVTDHDLHTRGRAALDGYDVIVTGAHPEYQSTESFDATEAFVARGGRLMYMGGNGFYWRVSTLPDAPHVMELRRAEGGVRIWCEPVGEYHHQSDGGLGGLWRRIGRAPNRLLGVGFSAQGSEAETRPYVLTTAARDPRVAFALDGVVGDEIGRAGPLGAAAGYETDRADVALGTPPHALVIARSTPFGPETHPVNEERLTHQWVEADDPLRADMTFYEGPNGGAVFATGSLLFALTLTEADGAARLCVNVLRRFADPAPFIMPTS